MAAAPQNQAAVDRRAREIEAEYSSSLADLNVNSKPLINMLTILAEENLDYAQVIVNAVEKHLAQVQPDVKLPILYLVDSIVKNVGRQYKAIFSQVIVTMFVGVFESVNERVREKMFSLRQTWNDVFPQSKLYALDIKINSIDPNWPITAQIRPAAQKSPSIHVNPNFLKPQAEEPDTTNVDMEQQLRDKQRELLELKARKLELELLATKKRIEEQEKQIVLQTASVSKEAEPDTKKLTQSTKCVTLPATKGRIIPPNAAMINLVKSRDPRLARQQAQLAAQLTAASTNSTPTLVAGIQIPPGPIVLDPSGKPISIKDRLGRIPKRVDPRLKVENDRKKLSSAVSSATNKDEATKKRDKDSSKVSRSNSSKSTSSERKKSSSDSSSPKSNSSPSKKKLSSSDKSPSRSDKISPKSSRISKSSSSNNSVRKHHDTSRSPEKSANIQRLDHIQQLPINNPSKDVDLRVLIPEKKLKLDHPELQLPLPEHQAKLVSNPLADQKKSAMGDVLKAAVDPSAATVTKDVDLRIPPPGLLKEPLELPAISLQPIKDSIVPLGTIESGINVTSIGPVENSETIAPSVSSATGLNEVSKKRSSTSNNSQDEPLTKKSKAEKIDMLFGNEDVDLRKFTAPPKVDVLVPPPPMISETTRPASYSDSSENNLNIESSSKAALQAVRAKIAEATKNKDRDKLGRPLLYNKLSDDPVERRRSYTDPKPVDVDLRQQQQLQHQQFQDTANDELSQDGMTANIRTIIAQAQEQMEKGEITPEQYNILMKQVIQLNETQKIRQAQRMEIMKKQAMKKVTEQHPQAMKPDTIGHAFGGQETTSGGFSPNFNDENEMKPNGPPALNNDLRGKIDSNSKFADAMPDIRRRDPRRTRDIRFNPPWDNRGPIQMPPVPPGPVMNRAPGPILNSWSGQGPFPMIEPPPQFPPPPITGLNKLPLVNAPAQVPKLNESVRTINIDGIQREIRFYDDIAVIFMSWDEPKEIGFQKGSRMVVVDDRDSFELCFNDCYKAITIEGRVYQMKLGSPTRELYIDDSWHECYFGDPPTSIVLDGITRVFKISGPAPQVKIGDSRNDLVAGKINMIVNAEIIIPVFLDSLSQTFEIQGQTHRLQFADFLLSVIINEQAYPVEFGGLPKVFKLRGKDYYIRFTALPKLVVPGRVYIRDMIRTSLYRDLRTPPRDSSMVPSYIPPMMGSISAPPSVSGIFPAAASVMQQSQIQPPMTAGLDYLTNLMPHHSGANASHNLAGYRIQSEDKPIKVSPDPPTTSVNPTASLNVPILQNINIDELYKKIVASGILTKTKSAPAAPIAATPSVQVPTATVTTIPIVTAVNNKQPEKSLEEELETIEPIYLNKPETLKRRQSAIVSQLFNGMQCSSCGVRFPPEQTMKYSQHLDWHFRQNRRDRDSARKAHSRKWYYDVSDWIQYEEIEDLEEREKNWFETQQGEQIEFNGDGDQGGGRNVDSPPPSCPAGSDEVEKRCHMCHDEFEQFYNEETEEWHLRNAIRVEDDIYHPLCYEDYKASLTMDETVLNTTNEESKTEDDIIKVKTEVVSDPDDSVKEITLDDDDDVIVLPPTEEVVTEIPDDDDIETVDSVSTSDERQVPSAAAIDDDNSKSNNGSDEKPEVGSAPITEKPQIIETRIDDDLVIQEPTIEKIDVTNMDESEDLGKSVSPPKIIKVKQEPKDDDEIDEEDALFEDVGTIESSMIIEDEMSKDAGTVDLESLPSPRTPPLESTSQGQLLPSIDGNVELQDAPATSIITNRIKINITTAKTTSNVSNSIHSSATSTANNTSSDLSQHHNAGRSGGSSISVLISGGSTMYNDNSNDDLYSNMDDMHHTGENSQNSSNQLLMIMPEEELNDSNKGPVAVTEEEPTDIAYDLKPSLRGIEFTRQPRVENGFDTSGLCSIM
ncbi:pre-mRNA cleavage complex 2 protein Pcf11-like isoform X2 [Uranotaenia lowii]|uniref:pre-mRNA cleavage complex 2 protein Pcf11-like isoform X2 n=1 Tax=Uranotaenia lowii TaxID=190385 RepID=UPI002478AF6C|nr:pre-mRNA cleavage complex 2 protein Pcf11-like isoform X2 [Uranotaenia lowii]